MGKNGSLKEKLLAERTELCRMLARGKSLSDKEVYEKSCQVDKLIVQYMQNRGV
ncbi:MAG: aspartyl-phosphate phosphatase Spo0E family protein [Thermoanaerobacteraceae bacterium]|nr:aspartyl-phosphate phosphatase Spo0E family protein [Thermoanaerobacteraceae bacterium]